MKVYYIKREYEKYPQASSHGGDEYHDCYPHAGTSGTTTTTTATTTSGTGAENETVLSPSETSPTMIDRTAAISYVNLTRRYTATTSYSSDDDDDLLSIASSSSSASCSSASSSSSKLSDDSLTTKESLIMMIREQQHHYQLQQLHRQQHQTARRCSTNYKTSNITCDIENNRTTGTVPYSMINNNTNDDRKRVIVLSHTPRNYILLKKRKRIMKRRLAILHGLIVFGIAVVLIMPFYLAFYFMIPSMMKQREHQDQQQSHRDQQQFVSNFQLRQNDQKPQRQQQHVDKVTIQTTKIYSTVLTENVDDIPNRDTSKLSLQQTKYIEKSVMDTNSVISNKDSDDNNSHSNVTIMLRNDKFNESSNITTTTTTTKNQTTGSLGDRSMPFDSKNNNKVWNQNNEQKLIDTTTLS